MAALGVCGRRMPPSARRNGKRRVAAQPGREFMARFEQFEIWGYTQERWQFVASFRDFEVAKEMSQNPSYRVRMMRVVYDNGKAVEQEVLSEIGAMREQP